MWKIGNPLWSDLWSWYSQIASHHSFAAFKQSTWNYDTTYVIMHLAIYAWSIWSSQPQIERGIVRGKERKIDNHMYQSWSTCWNMWAPEFNGFIWIVIVFLLKIKSEITSYKLLLLDLGSFKTRLKWNSVVVRLLQGK